MKTVVQEGKMLKVRVLGVLIVKNGWVVQSIGFRKYLPVGRLSIAVEYLNNWGIDEIVILDIDAYAGAGPNIDKISEISVYSQTPLSVGGGIKNVDDIQNLITAGADKVVVNTAFLQDRRIVELGAKQYGSQCMIVSLDVDEDGDLVNRHIPNIKMNLIDAVRYAQDSGAGEIFLNSVVKDGAKTGYDLDIYHQINELVEIPVIVCGGVGKAEHMLEAAQKGVQAVAAGNFFHFTELSVISVKQMLKRLGVNVRLDSYASYQDALFDGESNRVTRLEEKTLDDMRFEYVPEEVI